VRKIFDLMAREGRSMHAVSGILNEAGIPSPTGKLWRSSSIAAIITNPVYKGQLTGLRWSNKENFETGNPTPMKRPDTDHVVFGQDKAPALVTPEEWDRANAQRVAGHGMGVRRAAEPEQYLLRGGFIVCGACGKVLTGSRGRPWKDGTPGTPSYYCKRQAMSGCRESGSIRAPEIDTAVWQLVERILTDEAWVRQTIEAAADTTDRLADTRARLTELQTQKKRLAGQLALLDDASDVIALMNGLTGQIKALEVEVAAYEGQKRQVSQASERLTQVTAYLQEVERVGQLTMDEKRSVLRDFGVKVRLFKKNHEPRWVMDWQFDVTDEWLCGADDEWVGPEFTLESGSADKGLGNSRWQS
jgi:site-specific DNA recombinase